MTFHSESRGFHHPTRFSWACARKSCADVAHRLASSRSSARAAPAGAACAVQPQSARPQAAPDGAVWGGICVGFGRLPPLLLFKVRRRFSNLQTLSSPPPRALTFGPCPWRRRSTFHSIFLMLFYISHHRFAVRPSEPQARACVLVCARARGCARPSAARPPPLDRAPHPPRHPRPGRRRRLPSGRRRVRSIAARSVDAVPAS